MMNDAAIERIIHERAWAFHRNQPGMELDDLVQEAHLLIEKKVRQSYDVNGGASFVTFVYRSLTNYFISLTHINNRRTCECLESIVEPSVSYLTFSTEDYSKQAQEVIDLILNHSEELYGVRRRSGISPSQKLVREALRNRGWKHSDIDDVFHEIKNVLCNS